MGDRTLCSRFFELLAHTPSIIYCFFDIGKKASHISRCLLVWLDVLLQLTRDFLEISKGTGCIFKM